MNKEDKKLQKHLVDEMMKVSQTNPDVMYYMEVLMKSYEELEQKNIDLSQQLLSKKISDKDIEYKKRIVTEQELERYKNIIDELEKYLNEVMESYGYETDITDRIEKMTIKNILRKLKELKGE